MSFHEFIHARLISNSERIRVAAWRWKGRLDFRRCGWKLCRSGIEPYRGCWLLNAAWHPSLYVSCSLCRFGDAMPARIGNNPVGVGRKHLAIRRCASFSAHPVFCRDSYDTKLGQHIPLHWRRLRELTYEWWVYWHPMTREQGSAGYCCVQGFSDIGPRRVACRSQLIERGDKLSKLTNRNVYKR